MAATLVRNAIAELQKNAFGPLTQSPPTSALEKFVEGFAAYVNGGRNDCILAVFSHHTTAHEEIRELQTLIGQQFTDWHEQLAAVYVQLGRKPKRARREAHHLIAALYGALMNAKLHQNAKLFASAIERLAKEVKS